MEEISAASSILIPTVDLSPFMDGGDETRRKEVMDKVYEACTNLGVFQIETNDRWSVIQFRKFLKLTRTFFSYPDEVKYNSTQGNIDLPSGAGYSSVTGMCHEYEYLLMYNPDDEFQFTNIGVPTQPPEYRRTFEAVFKYFERTAQILEEIINDCLGLPKNRLKLYNNNRYWDFMMPMHYTPAKQPGQIGIDKHEDGNMFTITLQEEFDGLELFKDGDWIPIIPSWGKLVVVMGDIIQVLSNKKVRHLSHRALKNKTGERLAIDFVYNVAPNTWVEPLKEFTDDIGEKPKYKRFQYKEYADLVKKNYENPPLRPEDMINITYYEI